MRLMEKQWILFVIFQALIIACVQCERYQVITVQEPAYEPTWDSLDSRPLPSWYDDAKVGIFLHWGVYSVPTFGSEWFWKYWRDEHVPSYVDYMTKNFKPGFTYQEFAPQFTAEHFNADEWSKLFAESGAKYVVLTSKHHDGYALWPSKYSFGWNSMDVGPHRDLIGELSNAIRTNTTLKFGLYHSFYEWFNPMFLSDKQKEFNDNLFVVNKVMPEMKEIVNNYKPAVFWSDGDEEASSEYWDSTGFLAWLYNESPVRNTVVVNDRWGKGAACKHGGFYTCGDRYNPGVLQKHKWENAMTIDKKSWGFRADAKIDDFLTKEELIKEIVITVSTGGNILVNVGPTQNGLIQPIFVERLRQMGSWLNINDEAIYESRPWIYQNDTETTGVWYTCKSEQTDRTTVYAIVLDYPYDSAGKNLYSLGGKFDENTKARMLGYPKNLKWYGSEESMYIEFPNKAQIDKLGLHSAWTIAINLPKRS
ncbi:putative alpha-L-fucosidase isoform X2 [Sitodiplosis mosellana]|uniref:putative alpha-L-fucosidase isoform X2 n=1 Tax=Sitodiplosis mosellana TaxID=263140 RepID=UPI002443BD4C|nr:putative alpha-L-fucosidase isoform X2 [Sitodiplosis mosellana]